MISINRSRLKRSIVGTSLKLEQKDQIGFDPMASTAFLAADRFEALSDLMVEFSDLRTV